jgi:hypothetical protein
MGPGPGDCRPHAGGDIRRWRAQWLDEARWKKATTRGGEAMLESVA